MDPPSKTPSNKILKPSTPCEKTPLPRTSCDINMRDAQGPFHWEFRDKSPDFEASRLVEGYYFNERPTLEEWADKLGYK